MDLGFDIDVLSNLPKTWLPEMEREKSARRKELLDLGVPLELVMAQEVEEERKWAIRCWKHLGEVVEEEEVCMFSGLGLFVLYICVNIRQNQPPKSRFKIWP